MMIQSKASKIHANKTFGMYDGVNGSGKDIIVIMTEIDNKVTWQEMFTDHKEAANWWKHSCV